MLVDIPHPLPNVANGDLQNYLLNVVCMKRGRKVNEFNFPSCRPRHSYQ